VICSKGGRILMLGLPKVPITVTTPLPDFIFKSITLKARRVARFAAWAACLPIAACCAASVLCVGVRC
jgi:hypothetical protein